MFVGFWDVLRRIQHSIHHRVSQNILVGGDFLHLKLFNVLSVILSANFAPARDNNRTLGRLICILFGWSSVGALFMIHPTDIGSSTLFSLHCFIIIFPPKIYPSLCALFTFNNNKINIGWMRNGLQTYNTTSTCAPIRSHSLAQEIFSAIFFSAHAINRWDFGFYAFDKYRSVGVELMKNQ